MEKIKMTKWMKERTESPRFWHGVVLDGFGLYGLSGADPWGAVCWLAIVWGLLGAFGPKHKWHDKKGKK